MSEQQEYIPTILVFTTEKISDPGLDLAGQQHIHYSPRVYPLVVPCSSGVKPRWILRAFRKGFDGVFIAADGSDCPFSPSCMKNTAALVSKSQELMKKEGINPARLKMAAVCSVCAKPFANHMNSFGRTLSQLGNVGSEEYGE